MATPFSPSSLGLVGAASLTLGAPVGGITAEARADADRDHVTTRSWKLDSCLLVDLEGAGERRARRGWT